MSYNIDQVNGESSQAQIDEARRQANAEIQTISQTEAVVEKEQCAQNAKEEQYDRDHAVYEEESRKEETAEATVASEIAAQGAPAAVQLAGIAQQMVTDSKQMDPARFDGAKLAKQTNGMTSGAKTMEDVIDSMKGGSTKLASFSGSENPLESLVERSNIQSMFTAHSKPTGMAVPPDAINVAQVKSLTQDLTQKAHYEMTLSNAAKAEQELSAAQRNMAPGLGGPSMSLASGPKPPTKMTDEETAMA